MPRVSCQLEFSKGFQYHNTMCENFLAGVSSSCTEDPTSWDLRSDPVSSAIPISIIMKTMQNMSLTSPTAGIEESQSKISNTEAKSSKKSQPASNHPALNSETGRETSKIRLQGLRSRQRLLLWDLQPAILILKPFRPEKEPWKL